MKSWIMRTLVLAMLIVCVAGVVSAQTASTSHPAATPQVAAPESSTLAKPADTQTEANLVLPDLASVQFLGFTGRALLMTGLVVCVLGLLFGFVMYGKLKNMEVHRSMREISELIYETCKTYLQTQGKFILLLEVFIGIIMIFYFGVLRHYGLTRTAIIIIFSLVGIAGSYGVAWFGIRVNTFANSRAAFASLRGKPFPTYDIPLKAGMSIGMLLISVELLLMLFILLFVPRDYAGPCFIGFAIGESLGAAALRIAGGIFTKIADIGSDLMKIVFNIKEDDARNPGVIADCTGDNAGDSVGPTADGFETYGVTGVALITFILLAVSSPTVQTQLLVWIFVMRVLMIITSAVSYWINGAIASAKYRNADTMNFEAPADLAGLDHFDPLGRRHLRRLLPPDPVSRRRHHDVVEAVEHHHLRHPGRRDHPRAGQGLHLHRVAPRARSGHRLGREGGPSLNILAGLVAGNFSAYWMGITIAALMGIGAWISSMFPAGAPGTPDAALMIAPAIFAFGLIAFGFLGMGPVTIAVDSYGPVTDNAQSVFELSTIESIPGIEEEIKRDFGFRPSFQKGKDFLEANDGAGNTFKATAKPVLIGTAVVGATTMIFSIIVMLTHKLTVDVNKLSLLYPHFLLGLVVGGAVIYWFTGASTQAVSTGAYRAVEFIKANMKLDAGATRASVEDSKKVVAICTQYAQKGMFNIFLTVFFSTLAFACFEPFFFIGYLISIALFGLYQAIFMANAGGAWDNAKKIVEVELKQKGTPLALRRRHRRHGRRSVQGHVIGGHEPGDQIHDAFRPAGRRAGRGDDEERPARAHADPRRRLLHHLDDFRLPLVLRHAHSFAGRGALKLRGWARFGLGVFGLWGGGGEKKGGFVPPPTQVCFLRAG